MTWFHPNHSPHLFHIYYSVIRVDYIYLGYACFVCEKDLPDGNTSHKIDSDACPYCRISKVSLSLLSGPVLVRHMNVHILHDVCLKYMESPWGFCLNMGTTCIIYLISGSKEQWELIWRTHDAWISEKFLSRLLQHLPIHQNAATPPKSKLVMRHCSSGYLERWTSSLSTEKWTLSWTRTWA